MAILAGFSGSDFERTIQQARAALEAMRAGGGNPPSKDEPELEGVGEAADGRIRVTAVRGGLLKSVDLDPRAMRLESQELGEQIVVAANAALNDLRGKAASADAGGAVDTVALSKQLEQVQNEGIAQMERVTGAIEDALARIRSNQR